MRGIMLTYCAILLTAFTLAHGHNLIVQIVEIGAPTTNEDGSPLTDLSHYELCYAYEDLADETKTCYERIRIPKDVVLPYKIPIRLPLAEGIMYFALIAVDTSGNRSTRTPANKSLPFDSLPPGQPLTLSLP